MGRVPPKSRRFCGVCEKNTVWSYNKIIGHSECCQCGNRYGSDPDSYFTTVLRDKIKLEKELKKVKDNYINLLTLFISDEEQFSKKFKRKIKGLYNPNMKKLLENDKISRQKNPQYKEQDEE